MKVLFVTHNYLHIQGGGAYATRAIINAFAEIAESIKLLYPAVAGCSIPYINPTVESIPVYYDSSKIVKAINIFRGIIHRYYNVFEQEIDNGIDTVVFDTSIASHKLIEIARRNKMKVITIHHNYQVEFAKDDTPQSIKWPLIYWIRKAEQSAVVKSNLNICLTYSDADALKHYYDKNANFGVLGIFEPESQSVIDIKEHITGHNYIITGNLSVKQTTDALYPWIKEFYPLLKKIDPIAKLRIAGYSPQKELYELCSPWDIEIIDSPQDMEPYLMDSDYYICPTHLGSGIKLRIMDGLRAGLPVITHKNSLRGYESFLNSSVFVYDNTKSFEEILRIVLNKKNSRQSIQKDYLQVFSFTEGVKRLKVLLNQLMK